MAPIEQPKWPMLRHNNPTDLKEHALSLAHDFMAIQDFLKAGVSDIAPSLPKGIKRKIKEGIARGLVEVESREYSSTCVSVHDRELISNTIFDQINAKTAAAFHNRVPQHLFTILQDSFNELCLKLVNRLNAFPQQAGTASEYGIMPQTPPESPLEETDSTISDTDYVAEDEYDKVDKLEVRASKLKAQLQLVKNEHKAVSQQLREQANKIENEIQEVDFECNTVVEKHTELLEAIEERRLEQDRTGDYETDATSYKVFESTPDISAKQEATARCRILTIQHQAVVNRLFNMPAKALLHNVREAVHKETKPAEDGALPTLTHYYEAELLDDGNVQLWAKSTDDYGRDTDDASDGLGKMLFWDQPISARFASHLTEPYDTYPVEVIDITGESVRLQDRKQKAAVITDLVKDNLKAIPSLHIDIVKDIRFCRCTTNNNTKALVVDFSNVATANEVILQGLQWQGRHYLCEVFDVNFLDRCGCCQVYGHHANTCTSLPRCGNCAEQHKTKFCRSSYIKCALCDESHRARSSRCRAWRARRVDKLNARFPSERNEPSDAVPSKEPTGTDAPLSCPATKIPALPIEHVDTTKERPSNTISIPIRSAFSFCPAASRQTPCTRGGFAISCNLKS